MITRKSLIPILTTLPILSLDKPVNPENQRSKFVFGKNQELKRTLMHFLTSTRVCTTSMVSERSRKSAHSIINLTCRQLQILRCLSTLNSQSKLIVSWLHCKNQHPTLKKPIYRVRDFYGERYRFKQAEFHRQFLAFRKYIQLYQQTTGTGQPIRLVTFDKFRQLLKLASRDKNQLKDDGFSSLWPRTLLHALVDAVGTES